MTAIDQPRLVWIVRAALCLTWIAFLVSFFLPATDALGGNSPEVPTHGWQAFLSLGVLFYWPLLLVEPNIVILFPTIFLANIVATIAPIVCVIDGNAPWIAALCLLAGGACGLLLPLGPPTNLFIGNYLWILSLLLLAIESITLGLFTEQEV